LSDAQNAVSESIDAQLVANTLD